MWNDEYLSDTVALKKALNDGKSASYYFGDLPYLVSRGRYCMPKIEQLKSLFSHKNACWGVVFVKDNGQTANINMRVGTKHKDDNRLLPIYGLYIDKTRSYSQILSEGSKLYTGSEWGNEKALINTNKKPAFKGCAVVLQAADLKRGIFLPADGIRTAQFASGGLEYVSGCQPGEYCS